MACPRRWWRPCPGAHPTPLTSLPRRRGDHMRRTNRLLVLVCPIVLVAGCRDVVEPAPHDAERPVASTVPSVPNDPVALVYSTYLGGNSSDVGQGIAVDAAGNAYVTGHTSSANFPTTPGAFQTAFDGSDDAADTKHNTALAALVYSTSYLGSSVDAVYGVSVIAAD